MNIMMHQRIVFFKGTGRNEKALQTERELSIHKMLASVVFTGVFAGHTIECISYLGLHSNGQHGEDWRGKGSGLGVEGPRFNSQLCP